jgi:poly(3-hydroxybutyrate) depolymerase
MLRAGRSSLTILVALTATMTLLAVDGAPVLASPPHAATQDLRLQRLETEFQGTTREAFLFVPADLPAGSSLPLVFNYHGPGRPGTVERRHQRFP